MFLKICAYILGGLFIIGVITLIVFNVVGIIHDIKNKKSKKKGDN